MPPKPKAEAPTEWKSRFPVARIKKIMQADDDVGKVAQVVPVVISKALELFMQSLVTAAAQQAMATGHKRVLPGHLKMAVKQDTTFDFLEEHVAALPEIAAVAPAANAAAQAATAGGSASSPQDGRRSRQRSTNATRGRPPAHQAFAASQQEAAAAATTAASPPHSAAQADVAVTGSTQATGSQSEAASSSREPESEPPLKRSRVSDLLSPDE